MKRLRPHREILDGSAECAVCATYSERLAFYDAKADVDDDDAQSAAVEDTEAKWPQVWLDRAGPGR